jgi:hypothetical protein
MVKQGKINILNTQLNIFLTPQASHPKSRMPPSPTQLIPSFPTPYAYRTGAIQAARSKIAAINARGWQSPRSHQTPEAIWFSRTHRGLLRVALIHSLDMQGSFKSHRLPSSDVFRLHRVCLVPRKKSPEGMVLRAPAFSCWFRWIYFHHCVSRGDSFATLVSR